VFAGSRDDIRLASTHAALDLLLELVTLRDDMLEDEDDPRSGSAQYPDTRANASDPGAGS
jgi:hypothetical protein